MIQENVKITVNIRDFMAPWGDNQDAAEWYSYHEDDYDYSLGTKPIEMTGLLGTVFNQNT